VPHEGGGFFVGKFEDHTGDMVRLTIAGKACEYACMLAIAHAGRAAH
jgi:hypothetical protein